MVFNLEQVRNPLNSGEITARSHIKEANAKCRGVDFAANLRFISRDRDHEKVQTIVDRLKEKGYDLDLENLHLTGWYPLRSRIDFLKIAKDVFGWGGEGLFEMGRYAAKNSTIMAYYLRDLVDVQTAIKHAPVYWQKHYSTGTVEVGELRDKSSHLLVKDFIGDKVLCGYLLGYFTGVGEMAHRGHGNVNAVESECACSGGAYHKFELSWE